MNMLWLRSLLRGRWGRQLGSAGGLAVTVALLATLGAFIASSAPTMARRALATLNLDWQVLLAPGANPQPVEAALRKTAPIEALQLAGYADVAGLSAQSGGTTQTTGPGKALGLPAAYAHDFAQQIQLLQGSADGVLIASQTASNLHVTVGDTVTVQRMGLAPVDLKITGIVSLPNADSLFQAVGVPAGTAPQSPPDNVLLLPDAQWHAVFDPQAAVRPDSVRTQLHVRFARAALPADPGDAFVQAQRMANHVESAIAGSAAIANNLAARLDGVRADALYARVLFLFLGVPGVILAVLVTLAVAGSGAERRTREQALLRVRGASRPQILGLAAWEGAAIGTVGVIAGLAVAALTSHLGLALVSLRPAALWFAGAALVGYVLAAAAFLVPAWHEATHATIATARSQALREKPRLWQRIYVDLILLALGVAVFWNVARTGYQIVLATEGVAQTSVHYEAFLAPVLLWIGTGLLWMRLAQAILGRGRNLLARAAAPLVGPVSTAVAASLARQRRRIATGVALVALAFAFAAATAIFNTTYDAQARVDAELTNGADVTVTGTSATPAGPLLPALQKIPGVLGAQPLMHRYAYVGADLQDIFGIDAQSIGTATTLADAYFTNITAAKALALLRETPNGVLVSEETVKDFQLQLGDTLNLRLQSAADHQYHLVPFRFVGVVKEFPSAPKDSFLVANAAYLAQQTGMRDAEVVLLRAPLSAATVAQAARTAAAGLPGLRITTLGEAQALIGSSLTAVDLRRLTQVELAFSVLMIAGVAGLVLGLGLAERRRSFAILSALGARTSQIAAFLWGEGAMIVLGGALLGLPAGFGIAQTLVTMLAGAFDPPPQTLQVPWGYLSLTVATALAFGALAVVLIQRASQRPDLEALRAG